MKLASEGALRGILGFSDEPLVSTDYLGDPRSSIYDATLTQVIGSNFAKVMSWYDNEMGFAHRMVELTQLVAAKATMIRRAQRGRKGAMSSCAGYRSSGAAFTRASAAIQSSSSCPGSKPRCSAR